MKKIPLKDIFKFFIDFNLIDAKAFILSCRYCLIGIALPAVVLLVDFRFLWGFLYESCTIFQWLQLKFKYRQKSFISVQHWNIVINVIRSPLE